jgi:hypothetical protein
MFAQYRVAVRYNLIVLKNNNLDVQTYMAANRQVGVQALTLFALFCISRGLTPRLGLGDHIEQNESIGDFSRDKKFELCVVNNQNQDGDNKARQDVGTLELHGQMNSALIQVS